MKLNVFVLSSVLVSAAAFAHEHPTAKVSANFENLKVLVGTWEGKSTMDGKEQKTKVTYELTSGGTALVEKLMAGTPSEMTTVYANRGNDINVTHYCMLGNQPQMKLKKAGNGVFDFEMQGTQGISSKDEMHMHAIKLTVQGNKLKQEWTNYDHNKKGEVSIFEFTKT
jgi:hypothetical protein